MKDRYSLLTILESLCTGTQNRCEVNYLIKVTHSYACTYLKYRHRNLSHLLLAENVTITELAIDSIAMLFQRDEAGNFINLVKSFREWDPKIITEDCANFFINKLAAKCVEKYISDLLRQSDPIFSKVLNSLNYIIAKQEYKRKRILGTVYIVENNSDSSCGLLPGTQFLDELPSSAFTNRNKLLPDMFNLIKETSEYLPAIPLNALVIKIKHVNLDDFIAPGNAPANDKMEIKSLLNKTLNDIMYKVEQSYVKRDKLTSDDSAKIKEAFIKILEDLQDGGINGGLHRYFLEQFPELTFQDYQENFQKIFEYLFKLMREQISEQLVN